MNPKCFSKDATGFENAIIECYFCLRVAEMVPWEAATFTVFPHIPA